MTPIQKTQNEIKGKYLGSGSPRRSRVGLINLGCVRNTVDSHLILGLLKEKGHAIVDVDAADIVIVNTCSFIEDARRESVDVILDLIDLKSQGRIKKIIVAGCLAQRYGKELIPEFKEVDAFVGTLLLDESKFARDTRLTPAHLAYVKICESCYNQCSFCAIPNIKGQFISRPIRSIIDEIIFLDEKGVKEINIVGQDITAYGVDLYQKFSLTRLLKEIVAVTKSIQWVRLLYTFPAHITDELIDLIATDEKICSYIDIPLQHISDRILKSMKRGLDRKATVDLIKKIRKRIPRASLRTTFIVGFPGEADEDFKELLDFCREFRFDKVGVFAYSKEEGTEAEHFLDQVSDNVKKKRYQELMAEQREISRERQQQFVGQTLRVLIDEKQNKKDQIYLGRTEFDAPDVDGVVYVKSKEELRAGDFAQVDITDSYEYDLIGNAIDWREAT